MVMQNLGVELIEQAGSYKTNDSTRMDITHEIEIGAKDNTFKDICSLMYGYGDVAVQMG